MSTIDAEKLKEAIGALAPLLCDPCRSIPEAVFRESLREIHAAAEAHLATLPREETFTRFLVVYRAGESGPYSDEVDAQAAARRLQGVVVPLTGTGVIPGAWKP